MFNFSEEALLTIPSLNTINIYLFQDISYYSLAIGDAAMDPIDFPIAPVDAMIKVSLFLVKKFSGFICFPECSLFFLLFLSVLSILVKLTMLCCMKHGSQDLSAFLATVFKRMVNNLTASFSHQYFLILFYFHFILNNDVKDCILILCFWAVNAHCQIVFGIVNGMPLLYGRNDTFIELINSNSKRYL